MDTNLNKAFTIHSDLSLFEEKIRENKYSNLKNEVAKWLFTIATFIIYLMFISVSYAAPLLALQSYIELNASNVLAMVFIITLVFVAPAALSLAKHILYENVDSANATQAQRKHLLMIVAFLIVSGIYMEITSATSQQQEKAMMAVEHSKAGESIMNTSVVVGGNNSESIAKAEFKLVSCQRKLKEGSVKDCDNSQAALKSLKEQSALDRAATSEANDKAIITKQATLDKERDSHALPIAKMFSDLFGIELSIGKVIAAIISAIIFETAHSLLILKAIKLEGEQKLLKDGFDQRKVDYFHVSGKQYKAGDFKESEVLDLSEMRNNGNIKHFADTLSDTAYEPEVKKNPIGFMSHSVNTQQPTAKAETPKYERINPYTIREALRNGQAVAVTAPLDSSVKAAPIAHPAKQSLFKRFTQVLDKRANSANTTANTSALHTSVVHTSVQPRNARTRIENSRTPDEVHAAYEEGRLTDGVYKGYLAALNGTVKHEIECPICGFKFIKHNSQHIFCSYNRKKREELDCSKDFWEMVNPTRIKFARMKR